MIIFGDKRLPDRFWAKVRIQGSGCWTWTGSKDRKGYGWYSLDGRAQRAHRVTHKALIGPVPDGLQVLHSCDNPRCVNPEHLHAGTPALNMREKVNRGRDRNQNTDKTHCVNGHEFTPENTYRRPDRLGRQCKKCNAEANRRYTRRNIGTSPSSERLLAGVALPELTAGEPDA